MQWLHAPLIYVLRCARVVAAAHHFRRALDRVGPPRRHKTLVNLGVVWHLLFKDRLVRHETGAVLAA